MNLTKIMTLGGEGSDGMVPTGKELWVYIANTLYRLPFTAVRLYLLLSKKRFSTKQKINYILKTRWGYIAIDYGSVQFTVKLETFPKKPTVLEYPREDLMSACFPLARRFFMWFWGIIGLTFFTGMVLWARGEETAYTLSAFSAAFGWLALSRLGHWLKKES